LYKPTAAVEQLLHIVIARRVETEWIGDPLRVEHADDLSAGFDDELPLGITLDAKRQSRPGCTQSVGPAIGFQCDKGRNVIRSRVPNDVRPRLKPAERDASERQHFGVAPETVRIRQQPCLGCSHQELIGLDQQLT